MAAALGRWLIRTPTAGTDMGVMVEQYPETRYPRGRHGKLIRTLQRVVLQIEQLICAVIVNDELPIAVGDGG